MAHIYIGIYRQHRSRALSIYCVFAYKDERGKIKVWEMSISFFDGTPFPFDLYIWIIFTVFGACMAHSCAPPKATCINRIAHRHPTSEVGAGKRLCILNVPAKNTLVPIASKATGYQNCVFFFLYIS